MNVVASEMWHQLVRLAHDRKRTNPLLIARIFSVVMNERESSLKAWEPHLSNATKYKEERNAISPSDSVLEFSEKEASVSAGEILRVDSEDLCIFSWFSCHPIESENDIEFYSLLRGILVDSNSDTPHLQQIGSIVSLFNYRILEAMIMRNAQEVHPVSDFVLLLHSFSSEKQKKIIEGFACSTLDELMNQEWVQNLTVRGSAMLRLGAEIESEFRWMAF